MSETSRDKKISEQDILKVFDASDDPFLTASEIAAKLPVTQQAVNYRLNRMHEDELVGKKEAGARAVGWWAKVAPRLDPDVAAELEEDEEPTISHEELKAELDLE